MGPTATGLFREDNVRATRAIIDLDAIAGNVRALRAAISPACRMIAVVKADAYGHGASWVSTTALQAGADMLGVATVSEGQLLRLDGILAPILILGPIEPDEAAGACAADLEITVAGDRLLAAIQDYAANHATRKPIAIHLKIDTGLRRYGAQRDQAVALAGRIKSDPALRFAGISTHLASADEPAESFTTEQLCLFDSVVAELHAVGLSEVPRHVANSAAILTGRGVYLEFVRAGIALYGVPPSEEIPLFPGMQPALSLQSRVARVFPIDAGDSVGYNRTFRAEENTRGALIPIGYADGYRRSLAGKAWAGVAGIRAPVLGRVSMDQIVIEAPPSRDIRAGDPVQLLGGNPELGAPTIAEMAEMMGTNAYEVLVSLRERIPRVYIKGGEVIAVRAQGTHGPSFGSRPIILARKAPRQRA